MKTVQVIYFQIMFFSHDLITVCHYWPLLSWVVLCLLQGSDGKDGEKGVVGPGGDRGPRGLSGRVGDVGGVGADGERGPQGPRGVPGKLLNKSNN